MNNNPGRPRNAAEALPQARRDEHPLAEDEHIHSEENEAESVRSHSQTAQDRDHVIRGGDSRTALTKEFPT